MAAAVCAVCGGADGTDRYDGASADTAYRVPGAVGAGEKSPGPAWESARAEGSGTAETRTVDLGAAEHDRSYLYGDEPTAPQKKQGFLTRMLGALGVIRNENDTDASLDEYAGDEAFVSPVVSSDRAGAGEAHDSDATAVHPVQQTTKNSAVTVMVGLAACPVTRMGVSSPQQTRSMWRLQTPPPRA